MSKVQPSFWIPSCRTITRDSYEVYAELKTYLKKSLRDIQPRICLPTDTWTSVQRINYTCFNAHFIDRDWVLHTRILNFFPINNKKGERLAESICNCFLDWNLDNVLTVTVDHASSNDVTVLKLSKIKYVWTNMMDVTSLFTSTVEGVFQFKWRYWIIDYFIFSESPHGIELWCS